ncbi:hypothetical protein AFEL58S_02449 [Afipia felis]
MKFKLDFFVAYAPRNDEKNYFARFGGLRLTGLARAGFAARFTGALCWMLSRCARNSRNTVRCAGFALVSPLID